MYIADVLFQASLPSFQGWGLEVSLQLPGTFQIPGDWIPTAVLRYAHMHSRYGYTAQSTLIPGGTWGLVVGRIKAGTFQCGVSLVNRHREGPGDEAKCGVFVYSIEKPGKGPSCA